MEIEQDQAHPDPGRSSFLYGGTMTGPLPRELIEKPDTEMTKELVSISK